MDFALVVFLQFVYAIANLALIAAGLAIVFGMMRVINLAHGEFIMLGGYVVVVANGAGVNIWVSMFILAPLIVGLFGMVVERCLIRFLYGRMVDTLLASWGLSLIIVGLVTAIFGTQMASSLSMPIGAVSIGDYTTSLYEIFLIGVTVAVLLGIYAVLKFTKLGLIARSTMQSPEMAEALGVSTSRVYMLTFGFGSAIAGLAGALLAPVTGVVPTIGAIYIAKSFITVISGGASILAGTVSSATMLGTVNSLATYLSGPTIGEVGLLLTAIVLLRLMPNGITGRFFKGSL